MIRKIKSLLLKLQKKRIIRKSDKYRKYYDDKTSIALLNARQEFIKTGNILAMLKTLIDCDDGISFKLFDNVPKPEGGQTYIFYNEFDTVIEYTKMLFMHSQYRDNLILRNIQELKLNEINKYDLIIPVLSDGELRQFLNHFSEDKDCQGHLYVPKRYLMNGECGVQYLDLFKPGEKEIIVNAGCLDCQTDLEMIKWGKGAVKKIYALEPDPINAEMCRKVIANNDIGKIVTLVEKGAWNKKTSMRINSSPTAIGSGVIGENGVSVEVDKIDNIVGDDAVTFIKMDIEGAELQALKGAERTIIKNRPKLAICIYHKDSDVYKIPGYILSLVPKYRFYIRHYNSNAWETVLYAVCEKDEIFY